MKEKAPSYQRYPKQILGDDRVLAMDWDAYGMHEWLMSLSWQQTPKGTIPNDIALMRRWLRLPPNAVPCSITDRRCPCADHVWRRVYPQLRTAWVECGELTDVDARTGEPVFPENVRSLGSSRLANRGMLRTAIKQENYSNGNSTLKGARKSVANSPQIVRKSLEDEEEEDLELDFLKLTKIWEKGAFESRAEHAYAELIEQGEKPELILKGLTAISRVVHDQWGLQQLQYMPLLHNMLSGKRYRENPILWERPPDRADRVAMEAKVGAR